MSKRRDILKAAGASVGVVVLSLGALARRRGLGDSFLYPFDRVGADLASRNDAGSRCTAGTLTARQIDGPFYTPNTPERRDIRDPLVSENVLVLSGRVVDAECRPLAGAILDFWQTDHAGRYDQHGYRFRGHQYTDASGRFELVTVRPQQYTAMNIFRTAHIHVKVQGPDTPLLTTQLYLPDAEETNLIDGGYDPLLEIRYTGHEGAARLAHFDFVLASA
jgi:protocatechuate 3,4-dioxygenase beta subunit